MSLIRVRASRRAKSYVRTLRAHPYTSNILKGRAPMSKHEIRVDTARQEVALKINRGATSLARVRTTKIHASIARLYKKYNLM